MASGMYEKGVKAIMSASIDLLNYTISALLIDANSYTPLLASDESFADIPEAAILSEVSLSGKTLDGTTFRADDAVFASVEGIEASAVVLFLDKETENDSLLICYLDNAPELPVTPDGTDITIQWDTGVNGIFKL